MSLTQLWDKIRVHEEVRKELGPCMTKKKKKKRLCLALSLEKERFCVCELRFCGEKEERKGFEESL